MKRRSALGWLVTACLTSGLPGADSPAPSAVSIAGFRFSPAELTVSVGDTVFWTNDDTFLHTTTADSGAWASAELRQGDRFTFKASRAGRFAYHCSAHPVMRAVVVVRQ